MVGSVREVDASGERRSDALFLLGAGASVDGGLPTSNQLTSRLVSSLRLRGHPNMSADQHRNMVKALDCILDCLGEDTDYEVFAATAKELAHRDESVLAPFVERWKATVDAPSWDDFFSLYVMIGRAIRRELLVGAEAIRGFDYLQPLVRLGERPGGVTIASLNYDLTLEAQAARCGVALDTGFRELHTGEAKSWSSTGVRLLKLHGSVGWSQPSGWIGPGQILEIAWIESEDPETDKATPVIIFGPDNKMSSHRLFLQLYVTFLTELSRHRNLVIVGYSFRDPDINRAISDWLRLDSTRTIHIIDPSLPDLHTGAYSWPDRSSDSYSGMMETLGPLFNEVGHPAYLLPPSRITGQRRTASEGIAALLVYARDLSDRLPSR